MLIITFLYPYKNRRLLIDINRRTTMKLDSVCKKHGGQVCLKRDETSAKFLTDEPFELYN